ncbi:MAG: hypothetical protein JWN71_3772 [Xanthobacteraceae bacterium]|nr:hypothetical protein [Xanthobacteraceae bacterium]
MLSQTPRGPSFAMLLGLAWLLMAAQLLAQYWADTATTLPDTDDALRLVEMRNFLAGQGWFDLREPRLGLPPGYESHWSRLIDAGLAGLFVFFRLFADAAMAERLMGTAWPLLWMIPSLIGVAAIAWRLAGREAALIVLLLAVFNIPGLHPFRPGRIDHHNVQIAFVLLAVAATVWSDRVRWAACAAGALTGGSLAIGLEALPVHALCGIALGLRYVVEPNCAKALRDYGFALAAVTLLAFLVSVDPAHWGHAACDALAVNLAGAVSVAGLGVGVLARPTCAMPVRLIAMIGVGVAAAAVFAAIEPQCLRGPYAQMDPAVWAIWLDRVAEMQPLPSLLRNTPVTGMAVAAFPALAVIALLIAAYRNGAWRDFGLGLAAGAFLISLATMIGAIKAYPYVLWFGMPLVAVATMQMFSWFRLTGLVPRVFVAILVTPSVVTSAAMGLASVMGLQGDADLNTTARQACINQSNIAPFAALPPGLMVADELDWGPYLLAWTPHRVLAAPYHRLSESILTAQRILAAPPETARPMLSRIPADYLVTCGTRGPVSVAGEALDASLWGRLQAGQVPDWLEPLQLDAGPWKVYRVKPDS